MRYFKKKLQQRLQHIIGLEGYLFLLSIFKIFFMQWNARERNFRLLLSLLPEDAVVLDIGANIGVMTVLLARKCRHGKVYSFEPVPENFNVLNKVCRTFSLRNVYLHQMALGEQPGELHMMMPEENRVLMHGLSHAVDEDGKAQQRGRLYTVKQERLDNMQEIFNSGVTAIKIDVENFEIFVIRGAVELLRKYHPIIYSELWYGERRDQCMRLLRDELGYSVKVWEDFRLVEYDPERHRRQDFFFVHEIDDLQPAAHDMASGV